MDNSGALKFVRGGLVGKTSVPEMTHYAIQGGTIRAFNGVITLSSPIEFPVDCNPKAAPFGAALNRCSDKVGIHKTKTGRICIQSGNMRAYIELIDTEMPHQEPEGTVVPLDGDHFLRAISALKPFIGDDASRPWTNGILFSGRSAFATNNVCLVEYFLGTEFPEEINIPVEAVKQMLLIEQPPTAIQISKNSATFHYKDGRWIHTLLYSLSWPPTLREVIAGGKEPLAPIPPDLFVGLETLADFLDKKDGRIWIRDGVIRTSIEDEVGASYAVEGMPDGCYNLHMLRLIESAAELASFTEYPNPVAFQRGNMRGVILGLRA